MSLDAWITAGTLLALFAALATGRLAADAAVIVAVAVLLLAGIISPAEAAAGFSSPALLTIALLYVISAGLRETGAVSMLTRVLLGRPRSAIEAQTRLILPVSIFSAFTNNTTLVAAFLPALGAVARQSRLAASLLFMPLSFAAILGGICTLIGTSTNLTVAALIENHNRAAIAAAPPGTSPILLPEFGMFTQTPVGLCVAVAGVLYMLVFGRRFLPRRDEPFDTDDAGRHYMAAVRVEPASPVAGKTVEGAGLRQLPGLFLSRIDRADESITAVEPTQRIQPGDVLVFVGNIESVVDLQRTRGLSPVTDDDVPRTDRPARTLVEAVVSPNSPLVGQNIRDAGIRTRYNAVVIAVHRHGHRLTGKIGDIEIRPGDTLLLESGPGFARKHRDSTEFHLVSELDGAAAPRHDRAWLALTILFAVVVLLSVEIVDPLVACLLGAIAIVASRCCTLHHARTGIDWQVLIVVGGSLALGSAMLHSGLASAVAGTVLHATQGAGWVVVVAAVYALTLLFTTLMSNNAAAALMIPIAISLTQSSGVPFAPLAITIAIAASAEFITPLGYQTNLMVAGPGGYRWSDFLRFGGPLTLLSAVVCIIAVGVFYAPPL